MLQELFDGLANNVVSLIIGAALIMGAVGYGIGYLVFR